MTFWAKLLTIIVFVLSIAFAAMSGVNFAKRQDLQNQLKIERADREEEVGGLTKVKQDLERRKEDLGNALDEAKTKLESQELQLQAKENELKSMTERVADARKARTNLENRVASLELQTTEIIKANQEISGENKRLHAENKRLLSALTEEQTRSGEFQKENGALKKRVAQLGESLTEAEETIRTHEDVFSDLQRRGYEVYRAIHTGLRLPAVRGKVVTVDRGSGLVVLNVGSSQKVKKNFQFTIFRRDNYVATVNVIDVRKDQCAARVVTKKAAIQSGDDAATRLD